MFYPLGSLTSRNVGSHGLTGASNSSISICNWSGFNWSVTELENVFTSDREPSPKITIVPVIR